MKPVTDSAAPRPFEQRDEFGNLDANLRFLAATAALEPGRRILEIGSGKGALLNHLVGLGHDARGIEINQWMIDESRRLYGTLPLQKTDGGTLAFPDESFDVVISFDVFEHIPDTDQHLREVRRVLGPRGRYLLQTPNKWSNTVFETLRWRSFTAWRQDHCSLHDYWQLRKRFAAHGFDVEFFDVPVVTDFFRRKIRRYLGPPGLLLLRIANPDRFPRPLRTNFYVQATKVVRTDQF
jgi:SAM-dependent methyltransferase